MENLKSKSEKDVMLGQCFPISGKVMKRFLENSELFLLRKKASSDTKKINAQKILFATLDFLLTLYSVTLHIVLHIISLIKTDF